MFAGKKSAQIREILISESAWEEMTCLFAPSLEVNAAQKLVNAGNQRLKILTIAYCKNNSKENCKIQTVNKNIFPGQERNLESISGYDKIVVKYNNWITKDNGEFELAVH